MSRESVRCALAEAFLAGRFDLEEMVGRAAIVFGKRHRFVRPPVRPVLGKFGGGDRSRAGRLVEFLRADRGLKRAFQVRELSVRFARWEPPPMMPASGAPTSWKVPAVATPAELAAFLEIEPAELDWFADLQGRERTCEVEVLRHYRYRWVAKPSGSFRLIEAPKPRLKTIQRRLLDEILAGIPAHDSAHGFRPGRSVATFAAPHVGQAMVLKMDLRDFFVSITSARVAAVFFTAGYPERVASLLSGLCTNTVPTSIMKQVWRLDHYRMGPTLPWREGRPYACPHLPQGSPSSPALANLVAFGLDARLRALAAAAGATYTRYADDLVFSGDEAFARSVRRFSTQAAAIAIEEGFAVQYRKTRMMRQGVRQRAAGIVINQKINMARDDYDRLKAILCNCVRHGPAEQNRAEVADFRAHLSGRVAHLARLNSKRGQRLMGLFEQIRW